MCPHKLLVELFNKFQTVTPVQTQSRPWLYTNTTEPKLENSGAVCRSSQEEFDLQDYDV